MEDDFHRYHIGFARAVFIGLFDDLEGAVEGSWVGGTSITRHGRTWRISAILQETDEYYFGRIGFVVPGQAETLDFDDEQQDFVHGAVPSGQVVPFTMRKSDATIAYQLFPGVVRETTFTGALQALLNAPNSEYRWRVVSLATERDYADWRATIERVVAFDFRLQRPNPHYEGRPFVEQVVEGLSAEYVKISAREREDEGLLDSSTIFEQALDHTLRNYGKAAVTGTLASGDDSTWVKPEGQEGRVMTKRVVEARGDHWAPESVLAGELEAVDSVGELVDTGLDEESME